jgi:hypothetical protein
MTVDVATELCEAFRPLPPPTAAWKQPRNGAPPDATAVGR